MRNPTARAPHLSKIRRLQPLAASIAVLALGASAHAALFYWTGDNNNLWNASTGPAGTNWSSSPDFNNGTAGIPTATDDVFFNLFGAGNLNTQLGQDFSVKSLTFTADATNPVTIAGANTLTLGTGGLTDNSPAAITVSSNVALGVAQTWTNNTAGTPLTASGVISGAGINLSLAGAGAFTFSGANTYSGTTSLNNSGTTLTLNGANGALATSSLSLEGGSILNLDNTAANNTNRISDSAGITSKGGTFALKGASATETVGTLTLSTGATRVNVDAGSTLTFSNSLARSAGGTVNFSATGTTNIAAQTNAFNGIIGGYATIGNIGSVQQDANGGANVLDFAAVDGAHNVVPFTAYDLNDFTTAAKNTKVNGLSTVAANTTINSLYLTGAARVVLGTVGTTTTTLIIGSGGIISNAAIQTLGGSGPQLDLANSAVLGSGVVNGNNTNGGAITGTVTSATGDLVVTTASNLRIDAVIANNGATVVNLTKNGSGTLDLSDGNGNTATNTYTGITTINGGLVTIRNDRNLGAVPGVNTPNSLTLNGGELRMTATITLDSHRGMTVGPQGGIISYNGGNTTHLTGYLVTGSGSIQYSNIPGFGNVSANQCAMDIGYTTTNYQGGTTFFTQGSTNANAITSVIYFSGNDKVPDTSAVTVTNNDTKGILNLFGKSDTWGSLAGNGNILNGVATTSNLTVGGNNLSTTYSGSLGKVGVTWAVGANSTTGADNSTGSTANITLTKVGSGTMTLSGVNQYTGATSINGGTILVTGSLANTTVSVGNGTASGALGGNGTIAGAVTVTSTGHLAPAISPSSTSTLIINNSLTINSGATLDYNFGATGSVGGTPGTADFVNVNGSLGLSGALTLNITPLSGFGIGIYKLLAGTSYANTAAFTINGSNLYNYSVVSAGGALDGTVGGGVVPANNLYLQVLQGNPALFWTGSVNNVWDVATTSNWSSGVPTTFSNTANVTFDDNGSNAGINVTQTVAPNSITLNNNSAYSFSGSPINVATSFTKNQGGTATINNNVTVSTQTLVTGGTLAIGSTGTLNSVTTRVNSGGTLTVASGGALGATNALVINGNATFSNAAQTIASLSDTTGATTGVVTLNGTALTISGTSTYDGAIAGTGSLIKSTGGTLTLTNGASTFSGGTTINAGTLVSTSATGSPTGSGLVTIGGAGTLAGTRIGGSLLSQSGSTFSPGAGTPMTGDVGTFAIGGGVTISAGSVLDFDLVAPGTSDTVNVAGALTLGAGLVTLNLFETAGMSFGDYVLYSAASVTNNATFNIAPSGPGLLTGVTYGVSTVGNSLVLNIVAPSVTWTGAVDNNWDTTAANWTPGGTFSQGYRTTFGDSGANQTINVQAGGVTSTGMTFTNTVAAPYSIGGGPIGGPGGITKSGNGLVTLSGANTFTGKTSISGGTVSISAENNLGTAPGATVADSITLNGGALSATATLTLSATRGIAVGSSGGTLDVNGAATTVTYGGIISNVPSQTGTLTKTGNGTLTLNGTAPNTYTGATTVTGGTLNLGIVGGGAIPGNLTATGGSQINLQAPNQIADTADVTVGDLVTGGRFQSATNADTFHNLTIIVPAGSVYNTGNNVTSVLSSLNITGTLSVTNGEHDFVNSNTTVTANTLIMNGSIARIGANSNPSTIAVGAGGLSMTNAQITFGTPGGAFDAVVNLGGDFTGNGTNSTLVTNTTGNRVIDLQGGTRSFNIASGTTSLNVNVRNGGLTKTGPGTLALLAANSYVGPTTVNAGSLIVNGSLTGAITVSGASAVLGGSGTVGAVTVQSGGTISPGNSPGILSTGVLSMTGGTSLALEINGLAAGTQYDQLNVTGTVTLNNASLSLSGSYLTTPVVTNDPFFILLNDDVDPIIGTFAGVPEGGGIIAPSGQVYSVTYHADSTTSSLVGGNDVALIAVPEPGCAALLLGGLGCLTVRRRRSSRQA